MKGEREFVMNVTGSSRLDVHQGNRGVVVKLDILYIIYIIYI